MSPGTGVVVRVFTSVYESLHEFTSVCGFGRWADCLNQDLLDFVGFAGWWVSPGTGVVVRAFTSVYESLHEFTSVCGFGRCADCLNQD